MTRSVEAGTMVAGIPAVTNAKRSTINHLGNAPHMPRGGASWR